VESFEALILLQTRLEAQMRSGCRDRPFRTATRSCSWSTL